MRHPKARRDKPMRTDVYQRITDQIVSELEQGVRPWLKPWNAEHAAGRITRPLRGNGIPYRGINILMLWSAAMEKGFAAPIWMTFKQALEFNAHVRKGEQGSLVVYADKIIRAETDADTGEESERAIPFMKGYTVFNVEQIDGLPERFYAKAEPGGDPTSRAPPAGKPKSRVSLPLRCPCGADLTGTIEKHSGISSLASVFSGLLGRCAECPQLAKADA